MIPLPISLMLLGVGGMLMFISPVAGVSVAGASILLEFMRAVMIMPKPEPVAVEPSNERVIEPRQGNVHPDPFALENRDDGE